MCFEILRMSCDPRCPQTLTFGCRDSRMLSGAIQKWNSQNSPCWVLENRRFWLWNSPKAHCWSMPRTSEVPASQRGFPTAATSSDHPFCENRTKTHMKNAPKPQFVCRSPWNSNWGTSRPRASSSNYSNKILCCPGQQQLPTIIS